MVHCATQNTTLIIRKELFMQMQAILLDVAYLEVTHEMNLNM